MKEKPTRPVNGKLPAGPRNEFQSESKSTSVGTPEPLVDKLIRRSSIQSMFGWESTGPQKQVTDIEIEVWERILSESMN